MDRIHYLGLARDSEEFHASRSGTKPCWRNTASARSRAVSGGLRTARGFSGVDRISTFVERFHVTNLEIPRAPFGDVLGADREKAKNFMRSWYAYLDSKGWAGRSYHYMLDEPNTPEQYETVRKLGALVSEAEPRIRRLVVEQPYTQDPAWGALDDAIDIWCPLFGFIHEPSVAAKQAQGDAVWSYTALVQRAPAYHPGYEQVKDDHPPYWQIHFPLVSYRIAPWLNRRYGVSALLVHVLLGQSGPSVGQPGFRGYWNGEGAAVSGSEAGIEGPSGPCSSEPPATAWRYGTSRPGAARRRRRGGCPCQKRSRRGARESGSALPRLRERLAEAIVARAP